MKKILLNTLMATLLFSNGIVVYAETNTGTSGTVQRPNQILKEKIQSVRASTTQEIKQRLEERNNEIRNLKAKFASSTKEKRDQKQETLRKVAEQKIRKMLERMQATIDRELSIMAKIVTRIGKFKNAGGNTSESEKYVVEAKTHFDEAQSILNALKKASSTLATIIDPSIASSTNKDLGKVKNIVSEVENHLKLGHIALVKAVINLRGLSDRQKATTTQTTN